MNQQSLPDIYYARIRHLMATDQDAAWRTIESAWSFGGFSHNTQLALHGSSWRFSKEGVVIVAWNGDAQLCYEPYGNVKEFCDFFYVLARYTTFRFVGVEGVWQVQRDPIEAKWVQDLIISGAVLCDTP